MRRAFDFNGNISIDSGTDESMRLNWSMLNSGFINGIQAVMMLRLAETLYSLLIPGGFLLVLR